MLTTVNPGIFESNGFPPGSVGYVAVMLVLAFSFVAFALAAGNQKSKARDRIIAVSGASMAVSAVILVAAIIIGSIQNNDARSEHRDATRSWLSSDYGIDVTLDETRDLIGRADSKKSAPQELVVDLDGDLTSIKLIEGTGSTLQVQVVGGQVIQPRD